MTGEAPASKECADLVRAAAAGDEASLERLIERAQQIATRFSRSVCGDANDVEDVVQEALLRTYRNVGRIRNADAFRPWLYRTVRNACLIGRRRRSGEPAHLQSLDTLTDKRRAPDQLAGDAALRRELRRALSSLPGSYREILFLRELEGLSTREVAKITGISEDNVKTRLRRARQRLRATLAAGNPPHPSAH